MRPCGASVVSTVQQEVAVPFVSEVVIAEPFMIRRHLDFPDVGGQGNVACITPLIKISSVLKKVCYLLSIVPRCNLFPVSLCFRDHCVSNILLLLA